ncbi:MAG: hypothetical protein O9327_03350 [Polaromonas sp.]|nr:hypothetical protein [Polaromonas sp.]
MKAKSLLGVALFPIIALAPAAGQASPEVFKILGRDLVLPTPAGYCPLGSSAIEQQMLEMQRQNTSIAGELAHLAVPCDELRTIRAGKTDRFKRWVQVLVLKNKGEVKLVRASRAQFVQAVASTGKANPPDMAALSKRIDAHLSQKGFGVGIVEPRVTPLGSTDDAVFMEITMTASTGGSKIPLVAVGAVTMANNLPLGVYAYSAADAKGPTPAAVIQGYLDGVLRSNP